MGGNSRTEWAAGRWARRFEDALFHHRPLAIAVFALASIGLAVSAARLEIDTGFEKHLPGGHPFMRVFTEHRAEFGGADRLLVAVRARSGDIFTAPFLATLKAVTDAVFFVPGVNKASVQSLFTPNVRFVEVVHGGFVGGNVVPADYRGSDADMRRVRANVLKAGIVGRLVANDLSAAMVSAELVEVDPRTGERLDYIEVARLLEERLRAPYSGPDTEIHIIGFAKVVGDVADGAGNALMFFAIAFALSSVPVYFFTRSARYTGLPAVLLGHGGRVDPGLIGAVRLRHRSDVDSGPVPRPGHRRFARGAGGGRRRRRDPRRGDRARGCPRCLPPDRHPGNRGTG